MTFQVSVNPSGRQFSCEAGETILAAAIRSGVGLPYGCKNGACGSCKGKLVAGDVELGAHQERALPPADQTLGMTLFCCAVPTSDVTIEAREVLGVGDFPIKKVPVRVAKLDRVADDVMIMSLQLPATGSATAVATLRSAAVHSTSFRPCACSAFSHCSSGWL